MKLKIILCLLILFICYEGANAQSITWEKTYGYPHSDEGAYDVCESSDGNFYVVGSSGINFSTSRMYVLRINNWGDTLWTKKYNAGHYAYTVLSTYDNGCIISGYGVDSFFVTRLNSFGSIVWQKFYSISGVSLDMIKLSDGGYAACGYSLFKGLVIKIDSTGNLIWEKYFTAPNKIWLNSLIENVDGSIVVGGYVVDTEAQKIEILKLNSEGNLIWEKRFKILNNPAELKVIKKVEKGYFISGTVIIEIPGTSKIDGRVYFSFLNESGIQDFSYIFKNTYTEGLSTANLINNKKIILTSVFFPLGDTMYWNTRICDFLGNIIDKRSFPTVGYVSIPSVLPLENSDILFAGIYKPVPGSNDDEVFIVRTDSLLNSKTVGVNLLNEIIPIDFKLYQNYPNPFNPNTTIRFLITKPGFVTLNVYSIKGQLITTLLKENLTSGSYNIILKSNDYRNFLSSGVYFYDLKFDDIIVDRKKMILIK